MAVTPSRAEGTYPELSSIHRGAAVQQVSPAELRSHGVAVTEVPQPLVQPGTPFSCPLCEVLGSSGVCSARGGTGLGEFLAHTHECFLLGEGALKVVRIRVAAVQLC